MNKICFGCGVRLQSSDKTKVGYVPKEKLSSANYCMRCFKMMHYGVHTFEDIPKDSKEIIRKINKDNIFVIFLVDYLNISKEVIDLFMSIKKDKLLVVNKCELLPKNVKEERIVEYLRKYYHVNSDIKIKRGSINHGAKTIINYLEDNNINISYIVGISNSGKSTLINDLSDILGSKINKINTNSNANTTIDFIKVKLSNNLTLIDSPGFILDNLLESSVTGKSIRALSFKVKKGDTFSLLDNKYYINISDNTSIVYYTNIEANKVIKKVYKNIPDLNNIIDIKKNNIDIVLYGIGFITVKSPCVIKTNIFSSSIEIRDSMFGGFNE